jgi:transposase-like protein
MEEGAMNLSRRTFTREFKVAAVRQLEAGQPVGRVARLLEVNAMLLHRWRQEYLAHPVTAFPGLGKAMLTEGREAELERKIGQLTMENDFLKKALRRFEDQRRLQGANGGTLSTRRSRKR